jgi:hypothetical protein
MEITKDIRDAHKILSDSSVKFLEFVEKNPDSLNRSNYKGLYEIHFDMVSPQPWPAFISQDTRKKLEEAGREVFKLIKCIPERLLANDVEKMSEYYQVSADIIKFQLDGVTREHLKNILGRGDFIFSPSGLKCLEYNISSGIGGWSIAFMEPVYLNEPMISRFLRENGLKIGNKSLMVILFEHLLKAAVAKYPDEHEMNIAVIIPKYGKHSEETLQQIHLDQIYKNILQFKYNGLKGDVLFGDFYHLTVVDHFLFYKEKRIHVLVEMNFGDVPSEIMEVFKAGNILLYDGPITELLSNKLNLALLSENEDSDVFSLEERRIIKEYIPWTRKVVPGEVTFGTDTFILEDFILSNQDKLVMKPADRFGGEGVYVGRYISALDWKGLIEVALYQRNWLVQEYVESFPFLHQAGPNGCSGHDAIWGVFIFGEQYAGAFLRVLPQRKNIKGVINSHMGAEYSVILEVEE